MKNMQVHRIKLPSQVHENYLSNVHTALQISHKPNFHYQSNRML